MSRRSCCALLILIPINHTCSRDLTNIDIISNFKYLSFINVSYNYLNSKALDSLKNLPHVLLIYADNNLVESLHLTPMPHLKVKLLTVNCGTYIMYDFFIRFSTFLLMLNNSTKFDAKLTL